MGSCEPCRRDLMEGVPAGTRALRLGVVDREPAGLQGVHEVDGCLREVRRAHLVHGHPHTVLLGHDVAVGHLVVEVHLVAEARAAARLDGHPEHDVRLALLGHELLDLPGRALAQLDRLDPFGGLHIQDYSRWSRIRPLLLEVGRLGPGSTQQVLRPDGEHGVRGPGCGPHLLVAEEVPVAQDPQPPRVAEGRGPPDGEAWAPRALLGVAPPHRDPAEELRQPGGVGAVRPRGERQERLGPGHEHERLHDLAHVAPDGSGRVDGRTGPLGELPDLRGQPQVLRRRQEPLDRRRAAHGVVATALAASAAASSSSSPGRSRAAARPARSTSEYTRSAGGVTEASTCPATSTVRHPASPAIRRTPAGAFPRSVWASYFPAPVTSRRSSPRSRRIAAARCPRAWSRSRTCSGVAPFWGPYTAEAPSGPVRGLSTSEAATTSASRTAGSRPEASMRARLRRAAPPGGRSEPRSSSSRIPRAWAIPAPPSFVALPPMHTTTRRGRVRHAAAI